MTSTRWQLVGACRTAADPEIFFPVGEGPLAQQQTVDAKAICATCLVTEQCLTWALDRGEDTGVWGGLDERERRSIHRRRARAGDLPAPAPRTPASVLADRSVPAAHGHTTWTGRAVTIKGVTYTGAQLAWHVAYGEAPEGHLTVDCGHSGCITPEHLLDAEGRRRRHGTDAAYQAHHRRGEPPCTACTAAHNATTTERAAV